MDIILMFCVALILSAGTTRVLLNADGNLFYDVYSVELYECTSQVGDLKHYELESIRNNIRYSRAEHRYEIRRPWYHDKRWVPASEIRFEEEEMNQRFRQGKRVPMKKRLHIAL